MSSKSKIITNEINKFKLPLIIHFVQYVFSLTFDGFSSAFISNREIIFETTYSHIGNILTIIILHTPLRFNFIRDLVSYDRPDFHLRFVVVYILRNVERDFDLRVRFSVSSKTTIIPSLTNMISSAQWAEREVFDYFGIKFFGNLDMRKIISDYSFWGFAGRKDFPLVGIFSFVYSLNFLRVSKVRGNLKDFWSIFFQKTIIESKL